MRGDDRDDRRARRDRDEPHARERRHDERPDETREPERREQRIEYEDLIDRESDGSDGDVFPSGIVDQFEERKAVRRLPRDRRRRDRDGDRSGDPERRAAE